MSYIFRLRQKIASPEIFHQEGIVLSSLDEELYKKAIHTVENNIVNKEFDILTFCEELGVSRTVLFKNVKAWTDFTSKDFVQHIRLKRGAQLLEQGKSNISQISYKLGFKNPKYFTKCFHKKLGKNPTEYIESFLDS